MGKKLEQRLRIVWGNDPPRRYVPQAIEGREIGSLGWCVFDRKTGKELSAKDVLALTIPSLSENLADA